MKYLDSLIKKESINISTGEQVDVYVLEKINDATIMKEWANHFRNNYCADKLLDQLREPNKLSRKDFLLQFKFPDKSLGFGPATRTGDFAELLVSDYLEFVFDYYVPKDRYNCKFNRSNSSQGTDVIGLKMLGDSHSPNDEMVVFEVKGKAQKDTRDNRLQDAIDDAYKDYIRKGETLNAINQRAIERSDAKVSKLVSRFLNEVDRPYKMKYGAAAVYDEAAYSEAKNKASASKIGEPVSITWMIIIKREDLKDLITELYEEAANISDDECLLLS
jgi:hypothetical protein